VPEASALGLLAVAAIEVIAIDHVVVRVRDLEQSLRFYRDALGCAEERRLEELGLIQLRAGASLIDLVPVDSPLGRAGGVAPGEIGAGGPNVDHFALALSSFDEGRIRSQLAAHGIEPGEVSLRYGAAGNGPSMYIHDPDGNVVELKGPAGPGSDARA
jgi:catechol 2,3-dioxygenase-like lactoylglutathione lyase family enzyme